MKKMKRKIIKAYALVAVLISFSLQSQEKAPHIITFFFLPLSRAPRQFTQEKLDRTLATPGALSHSLLKRSLTQNYSVSGICVVYAGFSYFSDNNGQVMFPRQNLKPLVKLMVTQSIKPIFYPNIPIPTSTVHHWELNQPANASFYKIELIQTNDQQDVGWQASELPIPKKGRIPDDTIIIFADPKTVVLPTGIVKPSPHTAHFLLPDIYVTPQISPALSALRFLKVRRYFSPLRMVYKFGTKEIRAKLDP
jgi:hypothetical protein